PNESRSFTKGLDELSNSLPNKLGENWATFIENAGAQMKYLAMRGLIALHNIPYFYKYPI
ncbi:hypothetical protein KAX97_07670, partial [candidate division WOR-3 bacterium]|nr:hypothetical protein [candidate division WOR-3 bacterium]